MATVAKRRWTHRGVAAEAWVCRYVDEKGKRRSKQFDQKRQADAYRRQVERELHEGTHTAASDTATIRAVCDQFLEDALCRERDGRIGINRLVSLRHTCRARVVPHLGALRLTDLTPQRVDQFYRELQTQDGLGVRTARDTIYDLSLIERFGAKRGFTKLAVVPEALLDLRGTRPSRVRTFTSEEAAHLLSVVSQRGHNFKARSSAMIECMVNLAMFCGLRYGEIMGLAVEAIDLDRRMIKVRHSLLFNDTLKGPKTAAGVRDIPMPQRVIDLLSAWMTRWYVGNERGLLFRTPKGTIVSQANFHRQWTYLLGRAGLDQGEGLHFHALRHFCASWMIENGLPVTDVAALLGHSKFDMTLQVYAHPVVKPSLRHEAIERMTATLPPRFRDADASMTQQHPQLIEKAA